LVLRQKLLRTNDSSPVGPVPERTREREEEEKAMGGKMVTENGVGKANPSFRGAAIAANPESITPV
jgi:hypothetical protein